MDQAQQLRNVIKGKNSNSGNTKTARVITVTSGKGGVGKSNMCVNLAVCLRKAGKKVIIFDADFGLANIEIMFGTIPKYNLSDLIYHGKSIREIITTGPMDIGFISGGSGVIGLNNLNSEQIRYLTNSINELNSLCDYIIIDTGAGISNQVLEFVMTSPDIIMVTTPEPSSLTDSYSLLKSLFKKPEFDVNKTTIHVVANRVNSKEDAKSIYDKLNSVISQFLHGNLNYLGMIPQDIAVERAVRQQKIVSLVDANSNAAKAYEVLTNNLIEGTHDEAAIKWGITQLFTSFFNRNV